jgi:hypothetical protein
MEKTLKRETAIGMLVFLGGLAIYDLAQGGRTPAMAWAELLHLPIFGFVFAAFGFHALVKQAGWRPKKADTT